MASHVVEEEMKRFFTQSISDKPTLTGEEHKHLSVVLRAKTGDEIILCTGDGYDRICKIEEIRKNETVLSPVKTVKNESEPSIRVALFMSVMKGDKNDLVVQKATELGVSEIFPVITRYVQAHDKTVKTERFGRIVAEAAKQCGRSVLPKVNSPVEFNDAARKFSEYDLRVFPYENAEKPSLKEFLRGTECKGISSAAIFVGSEGGFAEEEAELLASYGVVPVTLGKRIMRAETANIAVLSALMYETEQWQ